MKISLGLAASVIAVLFFAAACSRTGGRSSQTADAAFVQASPEIKALWMQASEAAKTNDYVAAYNLFYELGAAPLSAEQKEAVVQANRALNDRLLVAFDKKDPEAVKALEEMRRHPPSRNLAQ